MTASPAAKLYSTKLLSLATELASYPIRPDLPLKAHVRSRTCGSTLDIALGCDAVGRVDALGLTVPSCAVGQAAAAIFARASNGSTCDDIQRSLTGIEAWLTDLSAPLPDWSGFEALEPAREHTGRHGAIVMPWKAAIEALSKA